MSKMKLRIIWIIPNAFMYLMFIGASTFVFINAEGNTEIGMKTFWLFNLLILLSTSIFCSIQIWSSIKKGKL
ncbi:hypothetical protein MKY41_08795 [Sporosarcina sp. FSL W7-1349]|uniref:hypothetical protein n=1 Tax=Sporosarcina sp. FSL W7-1349 TaxID=2921561 RepID=UPI0030F71F15